MDHGLLLCVAALGLLVSGFTTLLPGVSAVGVNYGMIADNLPPPDKVVALYKSCNISALRLFNPNSTVLAALRGANISVVLGTYNQDLQSLASDPSAAARWVQTNVAPFADSVPFRAIAAGNEVIPGPLAQFVLPASRNLAAALSAAGLARIPVTTAVSTQVLGASYPPSQSNFSADAGPTMAPLVAYLASQQSPLLVNVYPYFAYAGDPQNVGLDYALFTAKGVVVRDGALGYQNLFDAIVDAVHAAAERVVGGGVDVVVSETGWPSAGDGVGATVENARVYNNNVVAHVGSGAGTPRRPGKAVEAYLFAMFNEDQKPSGTEQHFGLFYPDMTQVYAVHFGA